MHSFAGPHESHELKQARPNGQDVDLLRSAALVTPSYGFLYHRKPISSRAFFSKLPLFHQKNMRPGITPPQHFLLPLVILGIDKKPHLSSSSESRRISGAIFSLCFFSTRL